MNRLSGKSRINGIADAALFLAVLLGVWELVYRLAIYPTYLFPSPAMVASSLFASVNDGLLQIGILTSLTRLLIGYIISIVFGAAIGLAMVKSPYLGRTLRPFGVGIQSFPSIAWVSPAILWFGFNDYAMIFVTVMGALFSITLGTYDGIRNTSPTYINAARNMGARGARLFFFVMLPAASPKIVSELRHGWSFAWRSLIGAEMIMATLGLGNLLMYGRELNDLSLVFAVMIAIFAVGQVFDRLLFENLQNKISQRWGLSTEPIGL
ncbi:MAG TPA: ABC transporter permease [Nitrososphaerales archaeon]